MTSSTTVPRLPHTARGTLTARRQLACLRLIAHEQSGGRYHTRYKLSALVLRARHVRHRGGVYESLRRMEDAGLIFLDEKNHVRLTAAGRIELNYWMSHPLLAGVLR